MRGEIQIHEIISIAHLKVGDVMILCLYCIRLQLLLKIRLSTCSLFGNHAASLQDFLKSGCLKKVEVGQIEYDMGPDSHISDASELLTIDESDLQKTMKAAKVIKSLPITKKPAVSKKRQQQETPQKGQRRKKRSSDASTDC